MISHKSIEKMTKAVMHHAEVVRVAEAALAREEETLNCVVKDFAKILEYFIDTRKERIASRRDTTWLDAYHEEAVPHLLAVMEVFKNIEGDE